MSPIVAMVADDLTGALDATAPFAAAGLTVSVARSRRALEALERSDADVVCVNTSSRHLEPDAAARAAAQAGRKLSSLSPHFMFKKVDSRLKGSVARETVALLEACGITDAVIAPAIPEMGRIVTNCWLSGQGIDTPILVAERFDLVRWSCTVPDCATATEMDEIAGRIIEAGGSLMAVGSRGLAVAMARQLRPAATKPAALGQSGPVLIAIGSRDPITTGQVARLVEATELTAITAPNGELDRVPEDGNALVVMTEAKDKVGESEAAARFAQSIATLIGQSHYQTLVVSGGETANAVLDALGIYSLTPKGEVLPGLPVASSNASGQTFDIITKSGGFGEPTTLLRLVEILAPSTGRPDDNRTNTLGTAHG